MSKNKFQKTVGQRIRERRIELGISQEQLAKLIGKTQDAVSGYESGSRAMRISELPVIARALDVALNYFLNDERDSRTPFRYYRASEYALYRLRNLASELFWIDESVRTLLREHEIVNEEVAVTMIDLIITNKQEDLLTEDQKALIELWKRTSQK